MKTLLKRTSVVLLLSIATGFAADATKARLLDKLIAVDPKNCTALEISAKQVATQDPKRPKALEISTDFTKPGTYPRLVKTVPVGTLNMKKASGIRFWARTENESKMHVHLLSPDQKGPEGRRLDVFFTELGLTSEWKQIFIPFSEFKFFSDKTVQNGVVKSFPGGIPISDADLQKISQIAFMFFVEGRGNDGTSRVQLDTLELVEN